MKLFWLAFGLLNVFLGAVGAFLPLLPTTPFLLLASWCFARSSDRFHRWLTSHPRLGPPIEAWRRERAISRRAKILAMITLVVSFAIALVFDVPVWALAIQLLCLSAVAIFILTRPEPRSS